MWNSPRDASCYFFCVAATAYGASRCDRWPSNRRGLSSCSFSRENAIAADYQEISPHYEVHGIGGRFSAYL